MPETLTDSQLRRMLVAIGVGIAFFVFMITLLPIVGPHLPVAPWSPMGKQRHQELEQPSVPPLDHPPAPPGEDV